MENKNFGALIPNNDWSNADSQTQSANDAQSKIQSAAAALSGLFTAGKQVYDTVKPKPAAATTTDLANGSLTAPAKPYTPPAKTSFLSTTGGKAVVIGGSLVAATGLFFLIRHFVKK